MLTNVNVKFKNDYFSPEKKISYKTCEESQRFRNLEYAFYFRDIRKEEAKRRP